MTGVPVIRCNYVPPNTAYLMPVRPDWNCGPDCDCGRAWPPPDPATIGNWCWKCRKWDCIYALKFGPWPVPPIPVE